MDIINFLEEHWTAATAVIGVITGYVRLQVAIKRVGERETELETKVCRLEDDIKTMNPIWQEIKERLARIETSLQIHFKDK